VNDTSANNFILFLELLAKKRNFILTIVVIATLIAVVTSFILPKWYQAKVLLLPPKDVTSSLPEMRQLSENLSITSGVSLPVMVTPSDVYTRILSSRTITDTIITRFDLLSKYDTESYFAAYEELLTHAGFRVTDEGLLEIAFEDRDPRIAADIANAFVEELEKLNLKVTTNRARLNRVFLEDRLERIKSEQSDARQALEDFQLKYRTIDFNEQTRLAINQAIDLKISLAKVELDLKINEQKLSQDNNEIIELKRRQKVLKEQIEKLETMNPDSSFFSLPIAEIPSLKGKYGVLYSQVRVNESLYNMLLERLEQVKIQENDKASTFSILDKATPPEIRHRPKRTMIVVGTFSLSLLFAILLAALMEYLNRLKDKKPEDYHRVLLFIDSYFGWLPGIKKRNVKSTG